MMKRCLPLLLLLATTAGATPRPLRTRTDRERPVDVLGRRPDGYHELETLFAFLRHGDRLHLAPAAADSLTIGGPFGAGLMGEGDNLVTRAQKAFRAAFGIAAGTAITLDKHLPIASGIGGGSADAAATLRGLARLHGIAPDHPALMACADVLGSDVPACLLGRTALGTGRGEHLEMLEVRVSDTPVLLVNPGVAVSTGAVFKAWDGRDQGPIPLGGTVERALRGRNDLEVPARALAPAINEALALLSRAGEPILSRMSGSGATCFALYASDGARAAAAAEIRHARPDWWCLESTLA